MAKDNTIDLLQQVIAGQNNLTSAFERVSERVGDQTSEIRALRGRMQLLEGSIEQLIESNNRTHQRMDDHATRLDRIENKLDRERVR